MRLEALAPLRVAVWGAGREGRAALAALRRRFPDKPLALLCRAAERGDVLTWLDPCSELIAGEISVDALRRYDIVVKSPGISPYHAPVPQAEAAGVRFVSGSAIWFAEHARSHVIGVTGTKGKSTTSALIAHLLRAAGKRVALAGNIGLPLLELLEPAYEPDWWVVELSSFQTRDLGAVPEIAVLLNLFPEHLDWHGSWARYAHDKACLLGQPGHRPRVSVLDVNLPPEFDLVPETGVMRYGGANGFHIGEGGIFRGERELLRWSALGLPGRHNASNLCAALAVVEAVGVPIEDVLPAAGTFKALPHRLQVLGERDGLTFVNDSISTTPYATLAALAFFADRSVSVLVGGHDRGLDWQVFRDAMKVNRVANVITMGANGPRIARMLAGLERPPVIETRDLAEAMVRARELTPPGGVVLLSPGAPSFGEFRDYVARGRRFAELAGFDPNAISSIEGMGL
jgi:UDP-N-acetylmuramoylalanine--D-glutamate ligase